MSSNEFRQSIRNASLRVKGDIIAGHIHAENTAAIQAELAALGRTRWRKTRDKVWSLERERAPVAPAQPALVRNWSDLPPGQQVPVFADICSAALGGLYQAVRLWSGLTTLVGVNVMPPILIGGPGSLRPQELLGLDGFVGSENPQLPGWAQQFASEAASAVNDCFRNWAGSFSVTGLPVFPHLIGSVGPAGGQSALPIPMGQIHQFSGALSQSSIEVQMMPLHGSSPEALVAERTCKHIARVFAEMWSTSVSMSMMQGLIAVGGGPGGVSATVVTSPGILKTIGENLPNPKKMLPRGGIAAADVRTALRQDLIAMVDRAAGAPTAPRPPDVKKR